MAHTIWQQDSDRVEWHNSPGNERSVFLGDQSATARFPVIAEHAGLSRWREDVYVKQSRSFTFTVELITAGDCRFVQDGRAYVVEQGLVFVKRKGASVYYGTGPRGFVHKRFVSIGGTALDVVLSGLHLSDFDVCRVGNPRQVVACMKTIRRVMERREPGYLYELSRWTYGLLTLLAENVNLAKHPAPVQAAIGFMERNLHRNPPVPEIARIAGMSVPHFYRIFRKHTGESPQSMFSRMKMHHAAQIVKYTAKPIKEIALMHGFEDPSFFTKQFRKALGSAPARYRETGGKALK